jgi:hypothetical protein
MSGAETCVRQMKLSDVEVADLLAKIQWRLDHFGPIAEDGSHHSKFETPAHAAMEAVEDFLVDIDARRILSAITDRDEPHGSAYRGQSILLRIIGWIENIDYAICRKLK